MKRVIAIGLALQLALQPLVSAAFANAATSASPSAPAQSTAAAGAAQATPSAMSTVRQGLNWLSKNLKTSIRSAGGKLSANTAANQLAQSGATQAQANTILQSEIAAGGVQPPAKPQGFWSRIKAFGQRTGANAQMSVNRVASVADFKPYTEVKLNSGGKLRWSPMQTQTYQIHGENGRVLNRSVQKTNPNVKKMKIEGPVDPKAFAKYQGQLTEARALIDVSKSELSALKLKSQAGKATAADAQRLKTLKSEIPKYEKSYKALEKQTKLANPKNSVKQFAGNAAKFALTSMGIRAGINVLSQAVRGDDVDLGRAFNFMSDTSFWTGTAGSFVGGMLFSSVANAVIPGSGALMRTLPGFLGAAAGYEVGSGNADRTNWNQLIASTVASAAAFAFIGGPIGIGASVVAGMLVNKLFESEPELGAQEIPQSDPEWGQIQNPGGMPQPQVQPLPQPVSGMPAREPQSIPAAQALPGGSSPTNSGAKASSAPAANPKDLNEAMQEMQARYSDYMQAIRDKDAAKAREQYELYKAAQQKLQVLRGEFSGL